MSQGNRYELTRIRFTFAFASINHCPDRIRVGNEFTLAHVHFAPLLTLRVILNLAFASHPQLAFAPFTLRDVHTRNVHTNPYSQHRIRVTSFAFATYTRETYTRFPLVLRIRVTPFALASSPFAFASSHVSVAAHCASQLAFASWSLRVTSGLRRLRVCFEAYIPTLRVYSPEHRYASPVYKIPFGYTSARCACCQVSFTLSRTSLPTLLTPSPFPTSSRYRLSRSPLPAEHRCTADSYCKFRYILVSRPRSVTLQ